MILKLDSLSVSMHFISNGVGQLYDLLSTKSPSPDCFRRKAGKLLFSLPFSGFFPPPQFASSGRNQIVLENSAVGDIVTLLQGHHPVELEEEVA